MSDPEDASRSGRPRTRSRAATSTTRRSAPRSRTPARSPTSTSTPTTCWSSPAGRGRCSPSREATDLHAQVRRVLRDRQGHRCALPRHGRSSPSPGCPTASHWSRARRSPASPTSRRTPADRMTWEAGALPEGSTSCPGASRTRSASSGANYIQAGRVPLVRHPRRQPRHRPAELLRRRDRAADPRGGRPMTRSEFYWRSSASRSGPRSARLTLRRQSELIAVARLRP